MTRIGRIGMEEIIKHIPHRHPFLLVDRVEDGEPSKWIRAVKNVTHNEYFLVGNKGTAIPMPQLLLVEAVAQCSGILCYFSGLMKPFGQTISFFAAIEDCTFYRDVWPGEQLIVHCKLRRATRGVVKIDGIGTVGGVLVIALGVTAVLRDKNALLGEGG